MGIRFYCPNGHKLNVKEFQAGRRGICPYCGAKIQIPLQSTRPSTREEMQAAAALGEAAMAGQGPSGVPIPNAPLAVPGGMSPAGDSVSPASSAQGYQASPSWPASAVPATASTMPAAMASPSTMSSPQAGGYASAPMGPTGAIGGVAYHGGTATDAAAFPSPTPSPAAAMPSPIYSAPTATEPVAAGATGAMPMGVAGAPAADPYAALGLNPVAGAAAPMSPVGGVALPIGAVSAGMAPAAAVPGPAAMDPLIEAGAAVWYVRPASGGQYGPAGPDAMRQWLAENRIAGDSLVWREGWRDWKTAAEVFPQLNPAAQITPFGALGVETSRGASGGGARVVLPRRSNSTLQLVLVIVLAIAVIVLGIVFYVVLTNNGGKPAPGEGAKPPAAAPSGTSRPPAAAPGGSTKPPASTPGGPTSPSGPSAPGGQTSPASPSNPSAPPAPGGTAPTAPTTPPAPATPTPSESSPTMPPASMSGG